MTKSIRLIVYLLIAVVTIVAVQSHKKTIIARRESTPPSVLSVLMEKGAPVKIFTVKSTNLIETMNITLDKCGSSYCFYLSSKAISNLKVNEPVFDLEDNSKIGVITAVSSVDRITGLVRGTVKLNKELESEGSEFYIVSIGVNQIKSTLAIPINSIEYGDNATYVWMFNDGAPEKHEVKTGAQGVGMIRITSGLRSGDEIVHQGQGLLYNYKKAFKLETTEAETSALN